MKTSVGPISFSMVRMVPMIGPWIHEKTELVLDLFILMVVFDKQVNGITGLAGVHPS